MAIIQSSDEMMSNFLANQQQQPTTDVIEQDTVTTSSSSSIESSDEMMSSFLANQDQSTNVTQQNTSISTNPNVPDQEFEMDDLDNKKDWLQQARTIYNYENKDKKFEGSNKELSDWFKDRHSSIANNLTDLGMTAYDTSNMSDDVKKSWVQSLDTYDRTNSDFGTFLRAVGNTFSDPLTYAGIVGTGGLGVAAKVLGKGAAKKGLKELLGRFDFKKQLGEQIATKTSKETAEEFVKTGASKEVTKEVLEKARKEAALAVGKNQKITGAVAGAAWGGGFAGGREALEVGVDEDKDEVDLLTTAIGTLAGGVLGGSAGRYLSTGIEKLGRGRALGKLAEQTAPIVRKDKVVEQGILKNDNDDSFQINVTERALDNQKELELNGTIEINIPKGNLTNDNIKTLKETYSAEGIEVRQVGNRKNQFVGTKTKDLIKEDIELPDGRTKTESILAKIKRNLWDDSGLGKAFKNAQTRRGNITRTIENNIQQSYKRLEKAVLKDYGIKSFKDLSDDELSLMNKALVQDSQAITALTSRGLNNVVTELQQMRTNIRNLQDDLLNSGVIDKTSKEGQELEATIKKSMDGDGELYITRQYEFYADPVAWKNKLNSTDGGQKIINDAGDLIRNQEIVKYHKYLELQNSNRKKENQRLFDEWEAGGRIGPEPSYQRMLLKSGSKYNEEIAKRTSKEAIGKKIDEVLTINDPSDIISILPKDSVTARSAGKILTRRQDIPKQIRLLLGEYNDPFTNYANTINKLYTTIETFNYEKQVSELIDLGEIAGAAKYKTGSSEMTASLRSVLPDSGDQTTSIKRIEELNKEAAEKNYSDEEIRKRTLEILETESGINKPLGGYNAYPEVAEAIRMNNELAPIKNNIFRNYLQFQGYARAAKTVYSPSAIARNFIGSGMMSLGAGYMNPSKMKGMIDIAKALTSDVKGNVADEELEKILTKGLALGFIQSGTDFNALKGALADAANKDFFTFQSPLYKSGQQLTKHAKKYNTTAVKLYQGMDDVWKQFAFLNERDMQRQTLLDKLPMGQSPDDVVRTIRTSTGAEVPITRLDEEAARLVGDHMQNYANVPILVKKFRRVPFADFLAFKTEMARTSKNIIKNAYTDMRDGSELMKKNQQALDENGNPTGLLKGQHQRNQGRKRLGSAVATMSSVPTIAATADYLMGMEEPVEDTGYSKSEGKERILNTDYNRGSNYLYFGTDQNGKGRRINLSYINPWAAGSDMITAGVRALNEGENVDGAMTKASIDSVIKPLMDTFSPSMVASAISNIFKNENEYGQPLYKEKDGSLNYLKTTMGELYKAFEPGGFKTARDIVTSIDTTTPKQLEGKDWIDAEPSLLDMYGIKKGKTGTKKYLQDQLTSLVGIKPEAYDLNVIFPLKLKSLERKKRDTIRSFKDVYQNRAKTTVQELVDGYRKSLEDSYSYAKDVNNLVQQYKAAASKKVNGKTVVPDVGDIMMVITKGGLFKDRLDKNVLKRIVTGNFLPKKPNIKDMIKWSIDTKRETGTRPPVDEALDAILNIYNEYIVRDLNPPQVNMFRGGSIIDSLSDILNPISKANVGEEEALKNYLGQPQPVEIAPVLPNVISEGEENEEDIPPMPDWLANIMKDISKKPEEDRDRTAPLPPEKPNETKRKAKYGWKDNEVIQEIIKDEPIIGRMIQAESSGNAATPDSSVGARGLMQIMKKTAEEKTGYGVNYNLSYDELFDPVKNVKYGADYFKGLKKYFGNDRDALIAYNWGPDNAKDWLEKGGKLRKLPKETRDYVKKILGSGK